MRFISRSEMITVGHRAIGTSSGIERPFLPDMRRAGRRGHVGPRAGARINPLGGLQLLQGFLIERQPLRLHVRRVRPADIRAFVPIQAQPSQIVQRLLRRPALDSRRIDVLHPHDHSPAARPDRQPSQQVRSRIAHMLRPGRRRREAADEL